MNNLIKQINYVYLKIILSSRKQHSLQQKKLATKKNFPYEFSNILPFFFQ